MNPYFTTRYLLLFTLLFACLIGPSASFSQNIKVVDGTWVDAVYVPGLPGRTTGKLMALRNQAGTNLGEVCEISLDGANVVECFPVGPDPNVIATTTELNSNEQIVWIGTRGDNMIRRFNLETNAVDREFSTARIWESEQDIHAIAILPLNRIGEDELAVAMRHGDGSLMGVSLFSGDGSKKEVSTGPEDGVTSLTYADDDRFFIGMRNVNGVDHYVTMSTLLNGAFVQARYESGNPIGGNRKAIHYNNDYLYDNSGLAYNVNFGRMLFNFEAVLTERLIWRSTEYIMDLGTSLLNPMQIVRSDRGYVTFAQFSVPGGALEVDYQYGEPEEMQEAPLGMMVAINTQYAAYLAGEKMAVVNTCVSDDLMAPPPYEGPNYVCVNGGLKVVAPEAARGGLPIYWSNGAIGDSTIFEYQGEQSYSFLDTNGCPGPRTNFSLAMQQSLLVTPAIRVPEDLSICPEGELQLTTTRSSASIHSFVWSNGFEGRRLTVTEPGSYSVQLVEDISGCRSLPSDTVMVDRTSVAAPSLTYDEAAALLSASSPGPIEWYLNEVLLVRTEGSSYQPLSNGSYTARYDSVCLSPFSEPVVVDNLTTVVDRAGSEQVRLYPNPANNLVRIELPDGIAGQYESIRISSTDGRIVYEGPMSRAVEVDISSVASGVYSVSILAKDRTGILVRRLMIR